MSGWRPCARWPPKRAETHRRRFVGRELKVITLHTPPELVRRGRTAALSANFLPVEINGLLPSNRLMPVRVTGLNLNGALEACQQIPASNQ